MNLDAPDPLIDLDAERAILGAILIDPVAYHAVADSLAPMVFGAPAHGVIWEAMTRIEGRGDPVDSLSVLAQELRAMDRLNSIGGPQYLNDLTDAIPSSAHIEAHAALVVDLARQRAAVGALGTLARWAAQPGRTPVEIAARIERDTLALTAPTRRADVVTGGELMETLADDLARPPGELPGIPTPLARLTAALGGWQPGQTIVLAARPSVGKTAFALQSAIVAAEHGARTLVCSLETPRLRLARRLAATVARVDAGAIGRRRALYSDEVQRLQRAMRHITSLPLSVVDVPDQSLASISALARRQKARSGLTFLMIDYLQLIKVVREKGRPREQEVAEITRGLHTLGVDLDISILLLAQLSRDVEKEKRKPMLSDLRESGAIEQDADVVAFLHREGDGNPDDTHDRIDVIAAKVRDGQRAEEIACRYEKKTMTFEALTTIRDLPGVRGGPVEYQPGGDAE